jgi:hypothetical protein
MEERQGGGVWERGELESKKVVELKEICKTLGLVRSVRASLLPPGRVRHRHLCC